MASVYSVATLEEVVAKKEEMEYYIDSAYAQAGFPKSRDDADVEKELDMKEKKKLLMTNIKEEFRL